MQGEVAQVFGTRRVEMRGRVRRNAYLVRIRTLFSPNPISFALVAHLGTNQYPVAPSSLQVRHGAVASAISDGIASWRATPTPSPIEGLYNRLRCDNP